MARDRTAQAQREKSQPSGKGRWRRRLKSPSIVSQDKAVIERDRTQPSLPASLR